MRIFIGVFLLLGWGTLYGQSMQKVEQDLLVAFNKIRYWSNEQGRDDSLKAANEQFSDLLVDYAAKFPNTLRSDFKDLVQEGLVVAASVDGLFRIYSWDTRLGGTAHTYETVYQYKVGNKAHAEKAVKPEGDMGRYYSSIYMLKDEDKVYYIGLFHAKYSSKDLYQGVKLFAIEENALNKKVKLIRTETGLQNELGFSFNLLTASDRGDRNFKLIYYDEADKKLHIPVVLEGGKVTKRFTVYVFNDEYFERLKD